MDASRAGASGPAMDEKSKELLKVRDELENLRQLQVTTAQKKEKADRALAEMKTRLAAAEGIVGTLEAKLAEATAATQALVAERNQLQAEIAALKSQLAQALKNLAEQRSKESDELIKSKGQIGSLEAKMQGLVAERDKLLSDVADGKSQLAQALKNLESMGEQRNKDESEVGKLTGELVKAQEQNAALEEKLKNLAEQREKSASSAAEERSRLQEELAKTKERLEKSASSAAEERSRLQEELAKTKEQLEKSASSAAEERSRFQEEFAKTKEQLENSASSAAEDRSRLQEELAKTRELLGQASDKADGYAATIQKLQDELNKARQDSEESAARQKLAAEQLQKDAEGLRQKSEQLQKELEAFNSKVSALEASVAALEKENRDCKGELIKKDQEAEAELAKLRTKHAEDEAANAQSYNQLLKELNDATEANEQPSEELIGRTAELQAASEEVASLQQKLRALEGDAGRWKANAFDAAGAKEELARAQRQIGKLEDALAQGHEAYKRVCAERNNLKAERNSHCVTVKALGMDIAQKVYSLQIAESSLQKALAELGAANLKIKSLEASSSMASDARSNKNYLMDYTRLKVVSDAANIAALSRNPEEFVRNLDSRLQAPMRIADESEHSGRTGEGSAESSRRLLKEKAEKEHYVSAYGLLRGPFP